MVQITPLLYAIPVLSRFSPSDSISNGLTARQAIDPSSLPANCQSPCQVINTMTNCAGDATCMCTNTIGSQLEQCMNCLVAAEPTVESSANSALAAWNDACSGNLSLGSSSSGGTTGTTGSAPSGTAGGSTPATTSSASSQASSSPNPLVPTGGAVGLKTGGSIAVCILAALAGAFMSL